MKEIKPLFLPMSRKEMELLGWRELDILLITGDAYVEHPSFGAAVIGRWLFAHGYKVGIIAQPDWKNPDSVREMGKPRIAAAVTAGNMDSMVCIYTAGRRLRKDDMYSPGGQTGRRPPLATMVYTQLVKQAFPGISVIIGGVEASMRRAAHYDYWQDKIRPSLLVDSKADILVFGMGEKATIEIVRRMEKNLSLEGIPGTARLLGGNASREFNTDDCVELPDFERMKSDKAALMEETKLIEHEINPWCGHRLIQRYGDRLLVIEHSQEPLSREEFDRVCELPYAMAPHPSYKEKIPAYETIKFSIPAVRGCPGGCAFCGLVAHQTRHLVSRSKESVLRSIERLKKIPGFNGIVSDIGGAASNIYGNHPENPELCKKCRRVSCMWPEPCTNYKADGRELSSLLKAGCRMEGIRKIFLNSGMRLDLALMQKELTEEIIRNHVSGHLKVAPEHLHPRVLNLMRKGKPDELEKFMKFFNEICAKCGKEQYLIPLFISNFPGCTASEMAVVEKFLDRRSWSPQQVQDYIPLPLTMGAAMYYSGLSYTGEPIEVNRGLKERRPQIHVLKKKRNGQDYRGRNDNHRK